MFPSDQDVGLGLRAIGIAAPGWAPLIASAAREQDISTAPRLAAFLATISHETGGLTKLVESLNYSVAGLLKNFGRHRISAADAQRLGRKPGEKALNEERQAAIANLIYGGAFGLRELGNTQPNDGWFFRGKGAIQLTGRGNHTRFAQRLGVNVVQLQALLEVPATSIESAAEFWRKAGCNAACDAGDMRLMRRLVNGGALGLSEIIEGAAAVRRAYGA